MKRVHKSLASPKAIEKLEFVDGHDLRNIQNVTPGMHLINTPLLFRKDHSGGQSSNVSTDDKVFYEEVFF